MRFQRPLRSKRRRFPRVLADELIAARPCRRTFWRSAFTTAQTEVCATPSDRLPEELADQFFPRYVQIVSDVAQDFCECADAEMFVCRNCDMVFAALQIRCGADVAAGLTGGLKPKRRNARISSSPLRSRGSFKQE